MAALADVVAYLDEVLRTAEVPDYEAALNGLQLQNSGGVSRVAAAVDYSMQSVRDAVAHRADLLVVHHGMFWNGAAPLTGNTLDRVRTALQGDLAIYSSHLPLDVHPELGNNALLARELQLAPSGTFGAFRGVEVGVTGEADLPTSALFERVRSYSARHATAAVMTRCSADHRTRRWAIVTGSGASTESLAEARNRGIDTLIVGEGPHHTAVDASDRGPVVMYAGHYATETLGVRALAAHVAERFQMDSVFLDIPTGL